MLAKIWKKALLAICIVACIFNIMSKLVNRTSLELNLKSVENGTSIMSIFKEKQESKNEVEESDTIEGVITENNNNVSTDNIKNDNVETEVEENQSNFVVIY